MDHADEKARPSKFVCRARWPQGIAETDIDALRSFVVMSFSSHMGEEIRHEHGLVQRGSRLAAVSSVFVRIPVDYISSLAGVLTCSVHGPTLHGTGGTSDCATTCVRRPNMLAPDRTSTGNGQRSSQHMCDWRVPTPRTLV